MNSSVLVLAMDDHIWVDSESLILYLRQVEQQSQDYLETARECGDAQTALAAYASAETVRQIADGLVLTALMAGDKVRTRRESRR